MAMIDDWKADIFAHLVRSVPLTPPSSRSSGERSPITPGETLPFDKGMASALPGGEEARSGPRTKMRH